MAAGKMREECPMGSGRWGRQRRLAASLGRCEAPCKKPDRCRLDIALATGDWSGKAQARIAFEAQRAVQEFGRIDERVAMQAAQARELRVLQSGDGVEDAHLLAMLELGLEAHHVEQRAEPVVLPQLYY